MTKSGVSDNVASLSIRPFGPPNKRNWDFANHPNCGVIRDCSFQITKELRVYPEFTYGALPSWDRRDFMSVVRLIGTILLVLIGLASSLCWAQALAEVRVRVLDYKTGRPVQRRTVGLLLPDNEGEIRNDSVTMLERTGRDGVAVFRLSQPLPPNLWIIPAYTMADWSCTKRQKFETAEVLEHGAVGDLTAFWLCEHHTSSSATAQPREVVVYTRCLNPWLRFRRFLHELFNG